MESIKDRKDEFTRSNIPQNIDQNLYNNIISIISSMEDPNYILENSDWSNYEIVDWIKCFLTPKVIQFDGDRVIHFIDKEVFLVMYKDRLKRETDKLLHQKNNIAFSDYQSPQVIWSIDSKDKYYLILETRKSPEWDTNEKIYRWIILNPSVWVQNITELQQNQIADILNHKF